MDTELLKPSHGLPTEFPYEFDSFVPFALSSFDESALDLLSRIVVMKMSSWLIDSPTRTLNESESSPVLACMVCMVRMHGLINMLGKSFSLSPLPLLLFLSQQWQHQNSLLLSPLPFSQSGPLMLPTTMRRCLPLFPPLSIAPFFLNIADCLSFVSSESQVSKPGGTCCSGLKTVLKADAECMCEAFKSSASLGITLNVTKATTLPTVCKASALSATNRVISQSPAELPQFSPDI